MRPRIAIPLPHSFDREYAQRAIPQYERAIEIAGGEPVRIALDRAPSEARSIFAGCAALLLPGSKADVDPVKFGALRSPHSAAADSAREEIDALLLEEAHTSRKPILGICYGLQSLNVFRGGSLIQHIPDFLPEHLRTCVNHEAGKNVAIAHEVVVEKQSALAGIVNRNNPEAQPLGGDLSRTENPRAERTLKPDAGRLVLPVNSSHHQSADKIGEGLLMVARCPDDGIVEALEGTDAEHFVLAVQWHPERSVDSDENSRAIFRAFIEKT